MCGSIIIKAAADDARDNEDIKEFNIVFGEIYNNADDLKKIPTLTMIMIWQVFSMA